MIFQNNKIEIVKKIKKNNFIPKTNETRNSKLNFLEINQFKIIKKIINKEL